MNLTKLIPTISWETSRKGNPYIKGGDYHVVVFPSKKKWSYRVENVYEAVALWAEEPLASEEAAKEAALAKLEEMEMVFAQDDVKIGSDLGSQKWWVEFGGERRTGLNSQWEARTIGLALKREAKE